MATRIAPSTLAAVFALMSVGPQALAETHRALAVGNSYSFGNQPEHAAGVYEQLVTASTAGWESVSGDLIAGGGYTLANHAADLNGDTSLAEALVTGLGDDFAWDVVILQDQSLVPGLGPLDGLYAASLQGLVTLDGAIQAKGAETVLMATWGRRLGDTQLAALYPDFETMNALLTVGYDAYQQEISTPDRTAWMAPVGLAFARVFEDIESGGIDPTIDGTLFSRLYTGDGSHPSELGSYLAGCVIFAAVTGYDPTDLWAPADVAPADAEALAKVARRIILDEPFEPLEFSFGERPRYPWVHDWSDWIDTSGQSGNTLSISAWRTTPAVALAADIGEFVRLEVGSDHDGVAGAGRLVLVDHSAKLDVSELVVGAGGAGSVDQRGGIVHAETLLLGEAPGSSGRYSLASGALRIGALEHGSGSGSMSMSGGTLVAATISAGLLQSGGNLQIAHDESTLIDGVYLQQGGATLKVAAAGATGSTLNGGHLETTEDITLKGTVELDITTVPEGERHLDVAVGLTVVADDVTVDAPEPFTSEVVALDDGRYALRITLNPGEPLPPGEEDPPAAEPVPDAGTETDAPTSPAEPDADGADDAGPAPDDPVGPEDTAAADAGGAADPDEAPGEDAGEDAAVVEETVTEPGQSGGGCDASGGPSTPMQMAAVLLALALTRRQRRALRAFPPRADRRT